MDVVWVAKQISDQLNQKGQSVVEYILLLAVITALGYTLYSNPNFKKFFGERGFFEVLRGRISFAYRYGYEGIGSEDFEYNTNKHPTYLNDETNSSRFFSPAEEYGK